MSPFPWLPTIFILWFSSVNFIVSSVIPPYEINQENITAGVDELSVAISEHGFDDDEIVLTNTPLSAILHKFGTTNENDLEFNSTDADYTTVPPPLIKPKNKNRNKQRNRQKNKNGRNDKILNESKSEDVEEYVGTDDDKEITSEAQTPLVLRSTVSAEAEITNETYAVSRRVDTTLASLSESPFLTTVNGSNAIHEIEPIDPAKSVHGGHYVIAFIVTGLVFALIGYVSYYSYERYQTRQLRLQLMPIYNYDPTEAEDWENQLLEQEGEEQSLRQPREKIQLYSVLMD